MRVRSGAELDFFFQKFNIRPKWPLKVETDLSRQWHVMNKVGGACGSHVHHNVKMDTLEFVPSVAWLISANKKPESWLEIDQRQKSGMDYFVQMQFPITGPWQTRRQLD